MRGIRNKCLGLIITEATNQKGMDRKTKKKRKNVG